MSAEELIEGALLAGAAAGSKDVASAAVKDAYSALRDAIKKRFTGNAQAETALVEYESEPEIWQGEMTEALTNTGAFTDPDILAAAQQLISLLDATGNLAEKYKVDLRDSQGVQVNYGSKNSQKISFKR